MKLIGWVALIMGATMVSSSSFGLPILTHEEAVTRFGQVSDVRYDLHLELTGDSNYSGWTRARFKLSANAAQLSPTLFLDFNGQNGAVLKKVLLNGEPAPYQWDSAKTRLLLPVSALESDAYNEIEVTYTNQFTRKGKGFHRAVDNEDGEVYVYTNDEPYFANEVFPLFDQPDLKAVYHLTTDVPTRWQVISNTREKEKKALSPDVNRWVFADTEPLSSYLFMVAAGPFVSWESRTDSGIPLRLFARKTLAQYVAVDDWFHITKASFHYYEQNFKVPYAFHKYDQVIVPETASGAMENAGAVTFNEITISRGKMSPMARGYLAMVVSHEMAHMWFGDLVTMKWWDDLWLNESFATFCSYLVMDATKSELGLLDSWQSFFSDVKQAAYSADSYPTTHPVVGTVHNTQEGSSNFDDITYDKGSSLLKQLYYYVGRDNFFAGVRFYFSQHAFGNATRQNFLSALAKTSGKDLSSWDQELLGTKGTNSVGVTFSQSGQMLTRVTVTQTPDPIEHRLRTHATKLGLYDFDASHRLVLRESIPVVFSQAETDVPEAVGRPAPAFIFPNAEDFDFALATLDPGSVDEIARDLSRIADPLLRQQLYHALALMVRNSELSASRFVDIVLANAANEEDIPVVDQLTSALMSATYYAHPDSRAALYERITRFWRQKLDTEVPGSQAQEVVFDGMLSSYATAAELQEVHSWLNGSAEIKGLEINPDRRWRLIAVLARGGFSGVENLIKSEAAKDTSNRGVLLANKATLSLPDVATKRKWLKDLGTPAKVSTSDAITLMSVFHNPLDAQLTEFSGGDYFDAILALARANDLDRKIAGYARWMYPLDYSEAFADEATKFVGAHPELPAQVRRAILNRVMDSAKAREAWARY